AITAFSRPTGPARRRPPSRSADISKKAQRFRAISPRATRTRTMDMDAIFFDLDGTLTDPKLGITRSIQYALQKLDHPTMPTEDELTWCIGPPLRASFVRLLGDHAADRAVALYRERFSDIG